MNALMDFHGNFFQKVRDIVGAGSYNKRVVLEEIKRCISNKQSVFWTDWIYLDTCKQVCNHITESPVNRALDTQETTDSSLSIQFGGQLMERKTVIYKVRWTSKEFKKAYQTYVPDDADS